MSYYDEEFYRRCAKDHMWANSSTSDECCSTSETDSEVERLKPPPIPLSELEKRMVSIGPNGTITRPGKFQIKPGQKENKKSKVNIPEKTVDSKQKKKRQRKNQKNSVVNTAKAIGPQRRGNQKNNFRNVTKKKQPQKSLAFTNSNNICRTETVKLCSTGYGPYGTASNSNSSPISTISNAVSSQNTTWAPSNRRNFTNQSTASNDLLSIDTDVLEFNSRRSKNAILKPLEFTQSVAPKPTMNVHRKVDNLVDPMRRMEIKIDISNCIRNESEHRTTNVMRFDNALREIDNFVDERKTDRSNCIRNESEHRTTNVMRFDNALRGFDRLNRVRNERQHRTAYAMPSNNARVEDNSSLTDHTRSKDFRKSNDTPLTISALVSAREANRNAITIGNHYRNGTGKLQCNLNARDNKPYIEQTRDLSMSFSSLKTNEIDSHLMGTGSIGYVLTDSVEEEQIENSLTPNSFNSYSIIASETESQRQNNNGTIRNDESFDNSGWLKCCCCPCIIM